MRHLNLQRYFEALFANVFERPVQAGLGMIAQLRGTSSATHCSRLPLFTKPVFMVRIAHCFFTRPKYL